MTNYDEHPRYIPVIKWQEWEKKALENIDPALIQRVLPCIEVRDSKQHKNLFHNLLTIWPYEVLVDYANPAGALTSKRLSELTDFLTLAVQEAMPVTPVFGPAEMVGMGKKLKGLISKLPAVALRMRMDNLTFSKDQLSLTKDGFDVLNAEQLPSSLIIDLGVSPSTWSSIEIEAFGDALKELKKLEFQSIHLLSGAFPASLASVKTGMGTFPRQDWAFWETVNAKVPELQVGFSDYGTLSPEWNEVVLGSPRSNSVAIRYTRDDNWLILRAGGKTKADSIAISQLLVSNHAKDFKGAPYSFGDKLIAERADPTITRKRCGHYHITEAWTHHIAHVLKEQY